MSTSLDRVVNTTNDLRSKAAGLGTDLDNVRNELVSILNNCSGVPVASESCAKVDSSGLRQEANFSALPNVDNELKNIRDILNQNFSGKAEEVCFILFWIQFFFRLRVVPRYCHGAPCCVPYYVRLRVINCLQEDSLWNTTNRIGLS